jgi:hypothetical protein
VKIGTYIHQLRKILLAVRTFSNFKHMWKIIGDSLENVKGLGGTGSEETRRKKREGICPPF